MMNTTKKKIIPLFFILLLMMTGTFITYSCSTWWERITQSYVAKKAEHSAGKIICAMKCMSSEAPVKTEKATQKNIQEALNELKRNFLALSTQVSKAKKSLEETIDEKHRFKKAAYQRLKNKLKGKLLDLSEELNEAKTMLEDKIATSHGEIKTEYQRLYDKLKTQSEALSSQLLKYKKS